MTDPRMSTLEQLNEREVAGMIPKWKAEQTAHPDANADRWALIYDPTPGGRDNGDGTRTYSLRFPALLISDLVSDPSLVAHEIAEMLNEAEQARAGAK